MNVQIGHRGLIPLIYKRGPIAAIDLDIPTIRRLVMLGVDVRFANGDHMHVSDLPYLCEDKAPEVPAECAPEESIQTSAPVDPKNPYAGMSKNQIKKAKRAAAEAAAKAASEAAPVSEGTPTEPEGTTETAPVEETPAESEAVPAADEAKEESAPTE